VTVTSKSFSSWRYIDANGDERKGIDESSKTPREYFIVL
jgi:hypothetical protein